MNNYEHGYREPRKRKVAMILAAIVLALVVVAATAVTAYDNAGPAATQPAADDVSTASPTTLSPTTTALPTPTATASGGTGIDEQVVHEHAIGSVDQSPNPAPTAPPAPPAPPVEPPAPPVQPPAPPVQPPAPPVEPPAPAGPQLLAAPLSLSYGFSTGEKSVTVKNTGGSTLQFSTTPSAAWLTVNPNVGNVEPGAEMQLTVDADPAGPAGTGWSGSIMFNSNGGTFSMPVGGTHGPVLVFPGVLTFAKPTIGTISAPPFACANQTVVVNAQVAGLVTTVKMVRSNPAGNFPMAYNDAADVATGAIVSAGAPLKFKVVATGPGGTVESAEKTVVVLPAIHPIC